LKKPISATIEEDLIKWMDSTVAADKKYRNKSHLIETALELLKSQDISNNNSKSAQSTIKSKRVK